MRRATWQVLAHQLTASGSSLASFPLTTRLEPLPPYRERSSIINHQMPLKQWKQKLRGYTHTVPLLLHAFINSSLIRFYLPPYPFWVQPQPRLLEPKLHPRHLIPPPSVALPVSLLPFWACYRYFFSHVLPPAADSLALRSPAPLAFTDRRSDSYPIVLLVPIATEFEGRRIG